MRIERTGKSTDRVTKGKVYEVVDNHIVDDEGAEMKPCVDKTINQGNRYWKVLEKEPPFAKNIEVLSKDKGEAKMLEIKKAVLINEVDSDDIGADALLELIEAEEAKLERLGKVKAGASSVAIRKLKEKHHRNIQQLVEILDAREENEDGKS